MACSKMKRRLTEAQIEEDRRFLEYLRTLPDYVAPCPELSIEHLGALETQMIEAQEAENRILKDLEGLRAKRDECSKALYDALFGGTIQDVMKGKCHTAA